MIAWLLAASLALSGTGLPPAETAPPPPETEQVLAVPAPLRERFRAEVLERSESPTRRLALLTDFMRDEDGMGLAYRHDATHTVAEAFRSREANCLTFTLVTIALAREAGLEAYAQDMREVLSWHQEGDNIVLTDHVNAGVRIQQRRFTVDVAADDVITRDPPRSIRDDELLAMYYSNRAMELVLAGDLHAAGPYLARSVQLAPGWATGLNNAGVLHMRNGDSAAAERDFQGALQVRPDHAGALANLATLYRRDGRIGDAERLARRAHRVLQRNPFHHFVTGHDAERRGDHAGAIRHYRRAIRLHRSEYRFHEALARAYLHAGDTRAAGRALQQGMRLSGDLQWRKRYQAKIDKITRGSGR